MKKTLVLGASDNPDRYSFRAAHMLKNHGHEVVPVGIRKGQVAGLDIHTDRPQATDIDTVTLYVGPQNQPAWYDYILDLKPKRILFNPAPKTPSWSAWPSSAASRPRRPARWCCSRLASINRVRLAAARPPKPGFGGRACFRAGRPALSASRGEFCMF